jgi:hypothetical protein
VFFVWSGFESLVDDSELETVPRELRHKSDDAQDSGLEGHFILLRLPWAHARQKSVYVRVQQPEGR